MTDSAQRNPAGIRQAGNPIRAEIQRFLQGLADLQFREMVAPQMLPTLYQFGILLSMILTVYLVICAFGRSTGAGVIWLLALGPALFLALVTGLRIGLEVLLAIFRLVVHVERLDEVAHQIQGQTEEIVEDLPRIKFWRAFTRPRKSEPQV